MNSRESRDILISWITISFAFAWIGFAIFSTAGISEFINQFAIMLVAVGTGFILHELAHKYVAINYGAHAEFRAWREGLLLALGLAIFTNGNFVFAAPGAVYVFGNSITTKQNGIISWAGPVTNIVIATIFGIAYNILQPTDFVNRLMVSVIYVNFFLAFFNMIPIFPLDGSKVFTWNKTAWIVTIGIAASGVFALPIVLSFL